MRLAYLILVFFVAACGENIHHSPDKTKELIVLTRVGATTYSVDETKASSGFDHDLVRLFAQELQIPCRIVVAANDAEILRRLAKGEAHMAAAWQIPVDNPDIHSSLPYFQSHNVLITHEASVPVTEIRQLANRTVHVVAGSRQEAAMREVQEQIPSLLIFTHSNLDEQKLLEGVATQRFEAALINNAEFAIGSNSFPELQNSLVIGPEKPITWLFAPGVDPQLIARANTFLERMQSNGDINHLKDRYFGHIDRLTQEDSVRFIERIHTALPKYRSLFQAAQTSTGIEWRVLAALAYQESHWEELATSRTGVRGMMMLTEDTADSLGVNNRLDPAQSIRAGAEYLSQLRNALPPSVKEPDRLWLALAAYNIGMGHLNAARYIAKTRKANPDSWYEMKKTLPLLAKPEYYNRLKSGKGRGGEAVTLTENVRIYTDILSRYERPYRPTETLGINRPKIKLGPHSASTRPPRTGL